MDSLVIRNDDVTANSIDLRRYYQVIRDKFPDCQLMSCTTVLSKESPSYSQSVYPDLPLKDKPLDYFFYVDGAKTEMSLAEYDFPNLTIASHGLWHFDHTKVGSELKKASIITSCRLLSTDVFVPPFNRWDDDMVRICSENGITMIRSEQEGWKSFEHNKFDASHNLWYFHSWRWTPQTLKEYLNV